MKERVRVAVAGALLLALLLGASACGPGSGPAARTPGRRSSRAASPAPAPAGTSRPEDARPAQVVDVVDGDTVRLRLEDGGKPTSARLIGLDTAELRDPRKPVQCFATEASRHAHELLDGQAVWVAGDPTQAKVDKYGRPLLYLWLPDGRLYNEVMIRDGYAHEYTYELPYRYQQRFRDAERDARTHGRGLWSPLTCNGDTTQPADSTTTTGAGTPTTTVPPAGATVFATCDEARAAGGAPLHRGDPGYSSRLDGDGDGIACE